MHITVHVLKLTSRLSTGLPRNKKKGKALSQRKKLSAVTKTNQGIVQLSAYLYIGTIAKVTSLKPAAQ